MIGIRLKFYFFVLVRFLDRSVLHSVAEQYPQLADQLLPNSAESYPALCGNITAPIQQDSTSNKSKK